MLIKITNKKNLILWGLILIPYLLLIPASFWYFKKLNSVENASFIIINKADMTLSLYNYQGALLQRSEVATGKNFGPKITIGDNKTPEGIFSVASIEDATTWTHDFKDDSLGIIKDAYGPFFIRLKVPGQRGIGIHGTHDEKSIGSHVSEGCIRMHNGDLYRLVNKIQKATIVVITPGMQDILATVSISDTLANRAKLIGTNQNQRKLTQKRYSSENAKRLFRDKNKK
jgi:hypothetical protein